ncbi:MAG: hypothetical protein GY869_14715 [Planctomycetes bacterium]|nr:hypothetical protein [Planctomycetota bacterium]
MIFKIPQIIEIDIKYIAVALPVRYDEEDIPNDFPLRQGNMWSATIEIDTGRILDWPLGERGKFSMKVCDEGVYRLLDKDKKEVLPSLEDYVPNDIIPGSYGDYVDLIIGIDGIITNWLENPRISEFMTSYECEYLDNE